MAQVQQRSLRIGTPDATRVQVPGGMDELQSWIQILTAELSGCNLVGVIHAPLDLLAGQGQNPLVPQPVVALWQAQDPTLQFQAEALVKTFLKACCPELMRANIDSRLPHTATAADWFMQIVGDIQTLRSSTYDAARRKEAAFKVDTDGLTNLEIVVATWVAMAHMVTLHASAGANLPASHWLVFLVHHLTATSLWLPDMDGLDQQRLQARAVQVANGKDGRDESVSTNHAAAAVTVGWTTASVAGAANRAGGVFECLWHGENDTHATENCYELKKMIAKKKGGGAFAGNSGKADGRNVDITCNTCGKEGHRTRRCPEAICRGCSKKGHIRRDCPATEGKKRKAPGSKGKQEQANMFKQFEAFMRAQAGAVGGDDTDSESESVCSTTSHRSAANGHMAIADGDDGDGDYTWGVGGH